MSAPPSRLRIAHVGPLPPERTGIADYAADLAPALAARSDITFYCADPEQSLEHLPADLADDGQARCRPYRELPARAGVVDAVIYQVGNNAEHHEEVIELLAELERYPSVVVLHEFVLHHLFRERAERSGRLEELAELLAETYGAAGERQARRVLEGVLAPSPFSFPLFEPVVDRARIVVCHSHAVADRIRESRPGKPVRVVPMVAPRIHHQEAELERAGRSFRRRHELPDDAFLVGCFGYITPHKRIAALETAFTELRAARPDSHLLLAGPVSERYPEFGGLFQGERGAHVHVLGRLELDELHEAMAAVDAAVSLRWPTGGETSGVAVRLLAHDRPLVVSDLGWFREIPEDCALEVTAGAAQEGAEAAELADALLALAEHPEERRALGRRGGRWLREQGDPARCAALYLEAVGQALGPSTLSAGVESRARSEPDGSALRLVGSALGDLGLPAEDPMVDGIVSALAEMGVGSRG